MQSVCLHYWFFHIMLYSDFSQVIPVLSSHKHLTCNKGIWNKITHFFPLFSWGLTISVTTHSYVLGLLGWMLSQPIIMPNWAFTVQGSSRTLLYWQESRKETRFNKFVYFIYALSQGNRVHSTEFPNSHFLVSLRILIFTVELSASFRRKLLQKMVYLPITCISQNCVPYLYPRFWHSGGQSVCDIPSICFVQD